MKHLWRYQILLLLTLLIAPSVLVFAQTTPIADRVSGRILIDVDNRGEAWYVYPPTRERYYLDRPSDAFLLMQRLGLGISNQDILLIPEPGASFEGDVNLRNQLAGRILLQVEAAGEAWYVHPETKERHFLGRPADAFSLMHSQSLGITTADLALIPIATEPGESIYHEVPFTAQAPFAEWNDLRQQEGCEEASVFMAMHWAKRSSFNPEDARAAILAMSDFQSTNWGEYVDTSALDTVNRLFKAFYKFHDVTYQENISAQDIKAALKAASIVLISVDGKALQNPYFVAGGPERHMLVVTGFDGVRGEFITNEPGTKRGEDYRYKQTIIEQALRDYPSGRYVPIPENAKTAMIIVHR